MASKSNEEVLQERIAVLGEELGTLFRHIENDLYSLQSHWRIYTAWFGTNLERVNLLNQASGQATHLIEKALFETAMLSVCRLVDPPTSNRGNSSNITVTRIPIVLAANPKVFELESLVESAKSTSQFARSWRNKRLAHSDFDVRMGTLNVEPASRRAMAGAIEAISKNVRWVGLELMDTTIITNPISEFSNDEISFLVRLYDGVNEQDAKQEMRRDLMQRGEYRRANLVDNYPDWLIYRPEDKMN